MRAFYLAALAAFATAQDAQVPLQQDAATTAAEKPLVDSEALQASIDPAKLLARARDLYDIARLSEPEYSRPTRVIGSAGHAGTLAYVGAELAVLGDYYEIANQSFAAVQGKVYEARLVLGDEVPASAAAMSLTPPTRGREPVHAPLALVANDGCDAADYGDDVVGRIALVRRGTCAFGAKSAHAGRAGALAAVVFNTDDGPLHGTLGDPSDDHVATFGLSGEEAAPFVRRLRDGDDAGLDGIAYVDAEVGRITTTNIIAQTRAGDAENCVMLGGHSDSVEAGPGINDDGSGTLTLLEIATQLARFGVNNCVRFAWWSGEEEGLLGSDHYVAQLTAAENARIRLFMDYDMLGSPNFAYQIYNATDAANPAGSEALRDLYVAWYEDHALNHTFIPFDGRSDYDAFIRHGIPGGGVATGAEGVKTEAEAAMFGGVAGEWYDPCYHQLCDGIANVNLTAWEVNTKLVAHSVATFARSFDGFPKRNLSALTTTAAAAELAYQPKYHGDKLFI